MTACLTQVVCQVQAQDTWVRPMNSRPEVAMLNTVTQHVFLLIIDQERFFAVAETAGLTLLKSQKAVPLVSSLKAQEEVFLLIACLQSEKVAFLLNKWIPSSTLQQGSTQP